MSIEYNSSFNTIKKKKNSKNIDLRAEQQKY